MEELLLFSNNLKLPKYVEIEALRIYDLSLKKEIHKGRRKEIVAAASLYLSCQINNIPRTLDELSEATNIEKKYIGRTYKLLKRILEIRTIPIEISKYVLGFSSKLNLSPKTESKAIEILEIAKKKGLTLSNTGSVGAAIYLSALINGEKITQREVADVVSVTEANIRTKYKELLENNCIKSKR